MDAGQDFLRKSRELLVGDYLPKIERCLERLDDQQIWWRANEPSNGIGNLILHLCGNVTEWIIGGVGGQAFERHRQQEFDERRTIAKAELLEMIRSVVTNADAVLGATEPTDLTARRRIQGYDVTVLEAIYHVVEHFSMHSGQIILLAKARTGADLGLWQPPAGD
jgi:hypothetical protein